MRLRGLFLVVILLAVGPAHAQENEAGLRGAVAPAQTVVEAAAHAIHMAVEESDRDGTPDRAEEILNKTATFIEGMKVDWRLSVRATYTQEAADALQYAVDVAEAVQALPAAAAVAATTANTCDISGGTTERHASLLLSAAHLDAVRARLIELAEAAPRGVEAASLANAAARIDTWVVDHQVDERCAPPQDIYLLLSVVPDVSHPLGRVRIVGSTNGGDSVHVTIPDLGFAITLPTIAERFHHEMLLPADVPLGVTIVRAEAGGVEAEANLTIERAPSTILLRGPDTLTSGRTGDYRVFLVSPLQARVDNATIHLDAPQPQTIQLAMGAATFTLRAPDEPQTLRLVLDYAGDALVQPASIVRDVTIELPAPPPAQSRDAEAPRVLIPVPDPSPVVDGLRTLLQMLLDSPLALLALLLAAIALWAVVAARRPGAAERRAARRPEHAAVAQPAAPLPAAIADTLVALFASFVSWLRARNAVPASATARDVGAKLAGWGVPSEDAVHAFERHRYGGVPEAAASVPLRMRLQAAWARVKEVLS